MFGFIKDFFVCIGLLVLLLFLLVIFPVDDKLDTWEAISLVDNNILHLRRDLIKDTSSISLPWYDKDNVVFKVEHWKRQQQ